MSKKRVLWSPFPQIWSSDRRRTSSEGIVDMVGKPGGALGDAFLVALLAGLCFAVLVAVLVRQVTKQTVQGQ